MRMIDRFLVIAEHNEVEAVIVANKIDLCGIDAAHGRPSSRTPGSAIPSFTSAPAPAMAPMSCASGWREGQPADRALGRGKSTLLNAIQPGPNLATGGGQREALHKGRHTTTSAELLPVDGPRGGHVVDSPGLRQIGLWQIPTDELARCYPDLRAIPRAVPLRRLQPRPRAGLRVIAAVLRRQISPSRHDSYRRLRPAAPEADRRRPYNRRPMEIAPDVHAVPLKSAGAFLITEERLTLIDAGLTGSRPVVIRYLEEIGRSMDDLDRIVCTHGHPDHVGGVRSWPMASAGGLHPSGRPRGVTPHRAGGARDRPGGSLRGRLLQAMTPHPGAATPLNDGDVLPVLGGLEVVHTPATAGQRVPLRARPRILFTGDVLQVRRGRLAFASPIFSHDLRSARASVRRPHHLEVDMIAFSHYRPMREGASDALPTLPVRPLRTSRPRERVEPPGSSD